MGETGLLFLFLIFFCSSLSNSTLMVNAAPSLSPTPYLLQLISNGRTSPDEKVRLILQRGDAVTAALQFIENVAAGSRSSPCQRTSLAELDDEAFQWRQSADTAQLDKPMEAAVKTANILNHYFLQTANVSAIDPLFLYSLVKSNVESDPMVVSSSIVLVSNNPRYFAPTAIRSKDSIIQTQDIGDRLMDKWHGNEWFWTLSSTNFTDFSAHATNNTFDLFITAEDGVWTAPYFDCVLTTTWHVTYGAPFFAHRANEVVFKGVASISVPISNVDLDQCGRRAQQSAFTSSHRCDAVTTECVAIDGAGFRRGAYRCYCKPNHYPASPDYKFRRLEYFDGAQIEEVHAAMLLDQPTGVEYVHFTCLPCRVGCEVCIGDEPCYIEYDMILRSLILCFQSFCSTIVFILAVVVFRLRKSKIFSSAMWIMLETILFGALLLYQTVIIRYFEPSVITCMLEPWFRGLGFAICYGAITLKIYRILAEFQTRKAHRVCVRDKDLLKYLLGIILVVVGYLLAWTAILVDNMNDGYSVVAEERTSMGLKYVMCRALWWDYVTEVGELLFLVFGVFLTYKVRNAKADCFHEKSALAWSVYVEALVSLLMYTIRHVVWSNLQPDYIYLLYFLRCQCTVTIILLFIYGPKLWYHHRPPEPLDYQPGRQLSSCGDVPDHMPETMKLHEAITSNGDVDFSEINLSDMDPEDIRTELRRVYTQLQILRNITMRKGNPHISRRRGGRKGTHRRFSLQTFHHRHKHYHEHEHEVTEVSKTPEESTASVDGLAESTRDDYNTSTPTVTFKEEPK